MKYSEMVKSAVASGKVSEKDMYDRVHFVYKVVANRGKL